jgi:hypothetical protein
MHITSLGLPFPLQLAVATAKGAVDLAAVLPKTALSIRQHSSIQSELLLMCR